LFRGGSILRGAVVMGKQRSDRLATSAGGRPAPDVSAVSQEILRSSHTDVPYTTFLREITELLLDAFDWDTVELWRARGLTCLRCEATQQPARRYTIATRRRGPRDASTLAAWARGTNPLARLCRGVLHRHGAGELTSLTPRGSFWTGNLQQTLRQRAGREPGAARRSGEVATPYSSLIVLPVVAAGEMIGLLQLKSRRPDWCCAADIRGYEDVAQILGTALANQAAHAALRERIKELTCLYSLAQLAERPDMSLDEILRSTAAALPAAWQYPDIATARIVLDGRSYPEGQLPTPPHRQWAEVMVDGQVRGTVEVGYRARRPVLDEGPFLQEERHLIDAIARQIGLAIARREAAEEKQQLQDQVRHADRLATIGELAAGVAHELNEPLGNILAFAQLAAKAPQVPPQVAEDLRKIVKAALHAREIVRQLMLFARKMPPQKTPVDLNALVEETLSFLAHRCQESHVIIQRRLAARLPRLLADGSQLHQVLVNLIVNAVQAMPEGGRLTVATQTDDGHLLLVVEDTGSGMSPEVLPRIFTPFFTTKDIPEGNGLGLPVVHGIVSAHGGTIQVQSTVGQGSRFEIRLPQTGSATDEREGARHDARQ
jgi:two-component system, NtrC family, sensor kinase